MTAFIGGRYEAVVPDVGGIMGLGYTDIRIYWAASETAPATLVSTQALVGGTFTYGYNKADAAATDWAYHAFYSVGLGEGPASERVPVAPTQAVVTRKAIRQGVGRKLRLVDIVTVTSAAGELVVTEELIDPDASPRRFTNRFMRVSSGALAGEIRRIRDYSTTPGNSGYSPATGTLIVGRTFSGDLEAGNEIELWRPKGDEDPSTMIDEATKDARHAVWWEEDSYLVTEHGVTEYVLPGFIEMESQVKDVSFAARTYPNEPAWTPVGRAEPRRIGGQVWLTNLEENALSRWQLRSGSVVRVLYNRSGDRLDDDADAWDGCPSLEWAIAEVAREFLITLGSPSGGFEDVLDVARSLEHRELECARYRRLYLPTATPRVEMAR